MPTLPLSIFSTNTETTKLPLSGPPRTLNLELRDRVVFVSLEPPRQPFTGQRIDPAKLAQAKVLRRQMTPAEKLLWSRLRRNQLGYHFRRQQVIAGFITDFYCDAARLAVEVDGDVHEQQSDYDESRAELFTQWGISTLRVTNEEVLEQFEETLGRIKEMCQTRG